MARRSVDGMLPLTPAVLHILLALADGDLHGYAMARRVDAATDGQVRMGPGTLYGSIQRMLDSALVEESTPRHREEGAERRRYYRLTPFGRRVLESELGRLAAVVDAARARQILPMPDPA
jgi:DNA-binding PadR family transcriptional regulator